MSVVTNIILTTFLDDPGIHGLNVLLEEIKKGNSFREVSDHCGGTKAFEASVYLAAFNWLDMDEFSACVRATEWEYPESVRVFVQEQEEDSFRAFHPFADSSVSA